MMRILVAEDSPAQAVEMELILQEAGYEVRIAENGATALYGIRESLPDILLTDLQMPEMTGNSQRNSGGRVAVCSLSQLAHETISVAGLDTILDLRPTQSEALARVRA